MATKKEVQVPDEWNITAEEFASLAYFVSEVLITSKNQQEIFQMARTLVAYGMHLPVEESDAKMFAEEQLGTVMRYHHLKGCGFLREEMRKKDDVEIKWFLLALYPDNDEWNEKRKAALAILDSKESSVG